MPKCEGGISPSGVSPKWVNSDERRRRRRREKERRKSVLIMVSIPSEQIYIFHRQAFTIFYTVKTFFYLQHGDAG